MKSVFPLIILITGLAAFFIFGLDKYLSLQALGENRQWLVAQVSENLVLASLVFAFIYIICIAFSLPGGTILTASGGFLFGPLWGLLLVLVSATLGATAVFLAAKTALGGRLRKKAGPWLGKLEKGFQENALSYLLFLRLNPAFPFFIVNLIPAFLGMKLRLYMLGTFLGIIPGSAAFTYAGVGLGSLFDSGKEISLASALTPEIITALIGLALIALLPVLFKYFKK